MSDFMVVEHLAGSKLLRAHRKGSFMSQRQLYFTRIGTSSEGIAAKADCLHQGEIEQHSTGSESRQ
jgi:hypothetical protein